MYIFRNLRPFVVALVVLAAFGMVTTTDAEAAKPRDLCSASGLSDGFADQCRDNGWTIRPRLAITPKGYVARSGLSRCAKRWDPVRVAPCIKFRRDGSGFYRVKSGVHQFIGTLDNAPIRNYPNPSGPIWQ